MTKEEIISGLKRISDNYIVDTDGEMIFTTDRYFAIYCNPISIYCDLIRINNTQLIDFICDGKIVAIISVNNDLNALDFDII